jgi:hypothetical protein
LCKCSINFVLTGSKKAAGDKKRPWLEQKITPALRGPYGDRVKVLTIQHNHWGRIFFSIQECIFGIRRIQDKMRSTVWTVSPLAFFPTISRPNNATITLILGVPVLSFYMESSINQPYFDGIGTLCLGLFLPCNLFRTYTHLFLRNVRL